ncbi:MAG: DUF222 domain-containing protein [Candidatus Dormibacteria bacterium]
MFGGLGGDQYPVGRLRRLVVREDLAGYSAGEHCVGDDAVHEPPVICEELVELRAAVTRYVRRADVDQRPDQMMVQASEVMTLVDILRREVAELVGEVDGTHEAERQSFHTTIDMVRHTCRLSRSEASELVVVGRHLEELPMSNAALDEGDIGLGHLAHLARTAAFIARYKKGNFDEVPLLALAEIQSVGRFGLTCKEARHVQDPDGSKDAEKAAVEMRSLTVRPNEDGTTYINALLDSTGAGVVVTALEAMATKCGPDDHRQKDRRMADALIDMASDRMARGDLSDHGGMPVSISVVCTDRTFFGEPGAAHMEYAADPISASALERFSCDATTTVMSLDGRLIEGELDFTHPRPTKRQRRALAARDGGCRYPGCHKSPSQCQVHHVQFRSHGGLTKLSNLILLCSFHHWKAHEGGWQIGLRDDGQVSVIPPMPPLARGPGINSVA